MTDQEHELRPAGVDFSQLFGEVKTIAVVGYSDNPERAGHYVAHYMADHGYNIIAVNPKFKDQINGLPCYPTLSAIPAGTAVEAIDVFRSPDAVPPVLEQALDMNPRPKYFWMQPGAENPEVAKLAQEEGMVPIMQACMMAAHKIWTH